MRILPLLLFACVTCTKAENIVFYLNLIGKSHLSFVSSLINLLVERGHNVDLVIAQLNSAVEIQNATKANRVFVFGFETESPWMKMRHLNDPFADYEPFNMGFLYSVSTELCRRGIQTGAVDFLRSGNYKAILASEYDFCGILLARAAGINSVMSYVAVNIMPSQAMSIGLPNSVSCISGNLDTDFGSFSLWGRISRLFYWTRLKFIWRGLAFEAQTALAREHFGPNFPDVESLTRDIDLVFVNSNEVLETPRVISHKVKFIGGAAMRPSQPINEELSNLLDQSPKGTVLISFGTQAPPQNIPRRIKQAIIDAASSLKDFSFIFKYEIQAMDKDLFSNTSNLHLLPWIPQNDLLHDKRVVGFVSHLGLNSFLESSTAAVPVVAIPLFADQGYNSRSAQRLGTAVVLEKTSLNGKTLTDALRQLLTESRYAIAAKRVAKLVGEKPQKAKEFFVEWVEFGIANERLHEVLNLPEVDVDFISYYCYDLVLLGFMVVALLFVVLRIIVTRLYRLYGTSIRKAKVE